MKHYYALSDLYTGMNPRAYSAGFAWLKLDDGLTIDCCLQQSPENMERIDNNEAPIYLKKINVW